MAAHDTPPEGEVSAVNPREAEGQPQQAQEQGVQPALRGDRIRKSHWDAAYQAERSILDQAERAAKA